jgi:hypothetical protein
MLGGASLAKEQFGHGRQKYNHGDRQSDDRQKRFRHHENNIPHRVSNRIADQYKENRSAV